MNASSFFDDIGWKSFISALHFKSMLHRTSYYIVFATGVLPNLWILLALLTSNETRARMRNKFICSLCLLHFLNSSLFTPIEMHVFELHDEVGCYMQTAVNNLQLMQDFTANWTLVLMIVVFIAQICDFRPNVRFSCTASVFGTLALLALPWVASLIVVPVITSSQSESLWSHPNFSIASNCVYFYHDAYIFIRSLDTAVPLLITVSLMLAAVVLRRRRFTRGSSSGMKVELLDRGPEIDKHLGYTAAVVVMVICDLPQALEIFEVFEIEYIHRFIFRAVVRFLSDTKVFFSILPWLIFPDVRERIKTWRPWHCARLGHCKRPGHDLKIVFKKDNA